MITKRAKRKASGLTSTNAALATTKVEAQNITTVS
jgi:hypothetical protein